jgi:hypothetical protein
MLSYCVKKSENLLFSLSKKTFLIFKLWINGGDKRDERFQVRWAERAESLKSKWTKLGTRVKK